MTSNDLNGQALGTRINFIFKSSNLSVLETMICLNNVETLTQFKAFHQVSIGPFQNMYVCSLTRFQIIIFDQCQNKIRKTFIKIVQPKSFYLGIRILKQKLPLIGPNAHKNVSHKIAFLIDARNSSRLDDDEEKERNKIKYKEQSLKVLFYLLFSLTVRKKHMGPISSFY